MIVVESRQSLVRWGSKVVVDPDLAPALDPEPATTSNESLTPLHDVAAVASGSVLETEPEQLVQDEVLVKPTQLITGIICQLMVRSIINLLINRSFVVHGSWLMAGGRPRPWGRHPALPGKAPSHEP